MHPKTIVHALIAAALLGLPSAALAQQQASATPAPHRGGGQQQQHTSQQQSAPQQSAPQQQPRASQQQMPQQHQMNGGDRAVRDDQRANDAPRATQNTTNSGYYNGAYNGGAYNGGYNNAYTGGYSGGHNNARNDNGQLSGVVSAFSDFSLQLNNRENVVLHQGTVINPTGISLAPGMQVAIYGRNDGNGTFEADTINVLNANGQYNSGLSDLGDILNALGL